MASSAAALKLAAAFMMILCIGSDLARPALASSPPSPDDQQEISARALLGELVEHELAEELGIVAQRGGKDVRLRDICSPACQTCLIVCAVTCVLNKEPIACFANCTVTSNCLGKPVAAVGEGVRG